MAGNGEHSRLETLYDNQLLLNAVNRALSQYVIHTDSRVLFHSMLSDLLALTNSEYGFIGELLHDENGAPYIKPKAISKMNWAQETQKIYRDFQQQGMVFKKRNSLYGPILNKCQPIISNSPGTDPRRGGVPAGHPPLNAFLGLPICCGEQMLGVVGVANRPNGYDESIINYLQPFLHACGGLLNAYNHVKQRRQVEQELRHYKRQLEAITLQERRGDEHIQLGEGFSYDPATEMLYKRGQILHLTAHEMQLLHMLVRARNRTVKSVELESAIWNNRVTGESSLRALMMRLRKKLPGVQIHTRPGVGYMLVAD